MTGVPSYSTTASENINTNTGINWDEGMPPASVNNSARQNMTDMRLAWNDASWFQYGAGSKTVAAVYASSTSVTFTGADATAYWHAGRRVKAVGSGTGTIYGKVASSSYGAGATTVNFTWDSGSLSNETLTVYAGTAAVTGHPIPFLAVEGAASGTFTPIDSSGATLTFAGATNGNYIKIGKFVLVWGVVVFPVTASAVQAIIGGLPFTASNTSSNGFPSINIFGPTTASVGFVNINATTFGMAGLATGAAVNNSVYSGLSVYFSGVYPAAT